MLQEKTAETPTKISDLEILLDGEEVAGYKIQPWTLSKSAALTPVFEKIMLDFKKRNIKFQDFFVSKENGFDVINVDQLFFVIMPHIPEILKITLGVDDKQVDKINQTDVMSFIVVIVRQNIEYLKNLFALTAAMAQAVKGRS